MKNKKVRLKKLASVCRRALALSAGVLKRAECGMMIFLTQARRQYMKIGAAMFAAAALFSFKIYSDKVQGGEAVILRHKYSDGEKYRILSTVHEDIKVNGMQSHHAEIVNRISIEVTQDDSKEEGVHLARFMTSENSTGLGTQTGKYFTWGEEYESVFTRDQYGRYTISDEYFMPVVRDLPVFPEHALRPGDTWTAEGHEAHDLRRTFNIPVPYKVPFQAQYTYLRNEAGISSFSKGKSQSSSVPEGANSLQQDESLSAQKEGESDETDESEKRAAANEKIFQVISVRYNFFFESPTPQGVSAFSDYPVATMGYSEQMIWWDNERGHVDHYTEQFRIIIETRTGNRFDFSGTAEAEVTEFGIVATEKAVTEITEKVSDMGIEDVSVSKTDKGLTLSIENIQFTADSAALTASEQEKIRKLAMIIAVYPDNDILVTGHTAKIGTPESCQRLSEERAESVAEFLTTLGAKDRNHIFTQGMGERFPIGPNDTEEGRAKNRRVEITILDN